MVQRGHYFAIVDEVDSILIDEARTPLIICGPGSGEANRWFTEFAQLATALMPEVDYEVDEKKRTVGVLEPGIDQGRGLPRHRQPVRVGQHAADRVPQQLDQGQGAVQARQGLRRHERRGADRRRAHRPHPASGRRYNEGIHQAIEAKEDVEVKAREPDPRHGHPAELLPPLRQALRHDRYGRDRGGRVHADLQARRRADPDQQADDPQGPARPRLQERGSQVQPRSSKTSPSATRRASRSSSAPTSVEKCEYLSQLLRKRGIKHEVLNAKNHAREAAIIAQAGRMGAVTVATNMAGRGTDIMLGGNAEFLAVAEMNARGLSARSRRPTSTRPRGTGVLRAGVKNRRGRGARRSRRRSAGSTCSAPSATSRDASTTSCAAGPAARATRARAAFYLSLQRRPDAPVQRRSGSRR